MDNDDYKSALEELLSQIRKKSMEAELDIRRVIAHGTTRDSYKEGGKPTVLPLTPREAYFLAVRIVLCRVDPILMIDRVSHISDLNGNVSSEIQWHSDYVSEDPSTKDLYEPVEVPHLDDDSKTQLYLLSETVEKMRAELEKQGD